MSTILARIESFLAADAALAIARKGLTGIIPSMDERTHIVDLRDAMWGKAIGCAERIEKEFDPQ